MSLYQKIADTYRICNSIRATAIKCETSRDIVRRVAITEGLLSTPRIEQIRALRRSGFSNEEIAKRLNISVTTVKANSPYERGVRADQEVTENALRIRRHRAKKNRKE